MPIKTSYANGEFSWVDLNAHNMDAAREFYTKFFGWTAEMMDTQGGPKYAMFSSNGQKIGGLGEMSEEMKSQGIPPLWNTYVNVDNLEATLARVPELGGKVAVPAMSILDSGWLAYITDPTGAMLGLWQKNQFAGSGVWGEHNSVCWNELATKDVETARTFFGELFGWEFEDFPGVPSKYYIVKVGGEQKGGLMQMTAEWGDVPPHWMVYFSVDDAVAKCERLKELGGQVCIPPFDTHVGKIAIVADAQGGTFSMIALKNQQG